MYSRFYGVRIKIMTRVKERNNPKVINLGIKSEISSLIKLLLILFFGISVSGEIAPYIIIGIKRALYNVIPAAFPFMIVSDLYIRYGSPEELSPLRYLFTRITNLPPSSVRAFICGNIAGFPLGASLSGKLYEMGQIDKEECEYLSAISNNPSVPFLLVAVGGMLNETDNRIGLCLLSVTFLSNIIAALLWRRKRKTNREINGSELPKYSFVSSVRGSGEASISIASFIAIFACISGLISKIPINSIALSVINSFIEVTSAISYISVLDFPHAFKLSLVSFSLSFGGMSVMMQSSAVIKSSGIIGTRYFMIKLTCALSSFLLSLIIFSI